MWSRAYLTERLGVDIADDPRFLPGHAPDSWTALTHHLRQRGVTDQEMELAGLVSRTRTGEIIDRFRNRLILPIVHDGQLLGFVARRHPDLTDDDAYAGPKYLNTPDTLLYSKGAQLYGPATAASAGAIPVLVEGPLDAIAITLAGTDRYVGYAPLGTTLTTEQASQIAQLRAPSRSWPSTTTPPARSPPNAPTGCSPSTASTPDTPPGLPAPTPPTPSTATEPPASPPPSTPPNRSPTTLIDERLRNSPPSRPPSAAIEILAARPGPTWTDTLTTIARPDRRRPAHCAASSSAEVRRGSPTRARPRPRTSPTCSRPRPGSPPRRTPTPPNAGATSPIAPTPASPPSPTGRPSPHMMQAAHGQGLDVATTVADLTHDEP